MTNRELLMITYLTDRLLRAMAILVGIGFIFFVANWHFYVPPPCAPGSPYMVACTTGNPEIQVYWDSLAKPAFDWSSIAITLGLLAIVAELRAQLTTNSQPRVHI